MRLKKFTLLTSLHFIFFCTTFSLANSNDAHINFKNVTHKVIIGDLCKADNPFDVDFMDANNDGYFDLFSFSHYGVKHCLYLQKQDDSHTFVYVDGNQTNYNQTSVPPRGSSRATFLDLNGDKKEDFTSLEADIKSAVWFNNTEKENFIPKYKTKKSWCASRDHCNIGEINGDGFIDVIHNDGLAVSYLKGRKIANLKSKGSWEAIDINSDTWPDLVDASNGGFWKNDNGKFNWIEIQSLSVCKGGKHQDFADFDNDGYIDLICANGKSKTNNNGGSRFLLKNLDGKNFKNVTKNSGIEYIGWKAYWSNYSNTYAADFNNDGLIDIVFAGSSYKKGKGLEFLINKGNFKFTSPNIYINDHCNAPDMGSYGCKPRVDVADFDNDGLLDLAKMYSGFEKSSVEIYKNTTTNDFNWLKIRVRGKNHNTDGLHTQINIYENETNKLITNYQVSNHFDGRMKYLHAGLNKYSKVNVEVIWPHDDGTEIFKNISSNQELIIYYSMTGSKIVKNWKPGNGW